MSPLIALLLSVLALAGGPLLYAISKRHPRSLELIDGFVTGSVGSLLLFDLLPHAFETLGAWALLALLAGLALPYVLEGRLHQKMPLLLALGGLSLHMATDGAALAVANHGADHLAIAVVLHRISVALVVWWLLASAKRWQAIAALLALAAATVLGFAAGQWLGVQGDGAMVAGLQALVAGSLLHVIILHRPGEPHGHDHHHDHHDHHDHHHHHHHAPNWAWAETLGTIAGVLMIVVISGHTHHHQTTSGFGARFLHLSLETAPALLLGYALAGLLTTGVRAASVRWLAKGSSVGQAAKGMLFGIPLPICSCGVVPVYRGLVQKGAPATAAMAFLVATPELGVESLLLSIPLLGGTLTGARIAAAAVVALVVGWGVGRFVPSTAVQEEPAQSQSSTVGEKLRRALAFGFDEIVEHTSAWILLGLAIAAALEPAALSGVLSALPPGIEVPIFALAGVPLYVCASGATPLAAALIFAGASPGAALAFLLAGPATNVTTFGVLSKLHGKRIALAFGMGVFGVAVLLGFGVNMSLQVQLQPPSDTHAHESFGWLSWGALALLTIAFGRVLLRVGPKGLIRAVFTGDTH